jgi:formylmethanofuran dehydrogenase subunit C
MSASVRLTLRAAIDQPIEIDGLTPDRMANLTEADIAALPVLAGSHRAALGDFFTVQGERSDRLHIEGDLRNVDRVGAGTAAGALLIHGSAGRRIGAGMTGGWIDVRGDVSDEAGLGMHGGALRITGDAGNRLGAAPAGAAKGNVGAEAARAIIAGTLVVFGGIGANPGRGSKRGSIVALGAIDIPSTYAYACSYQPTYVRLLLTYLYRRYGMDSPHGVLDGPYARYCGDASPGKGEILKFEQV